MGKEITKADTARVDTAVGAFLGTLNGMQDRTASFQRKLVLDGVVAIAKLHGAIAEIDGAPSRDALHTRIASDAGSVSKSTLDRWGRVSDIHAQLGVKPSEGSASAVYAITEGGWTAAREAVKQLESVESADQLVEIVAEAMNENPRVVAAPKKKELTADAVESAGYTPEAFAASVTALLDRVPEGDVPAAIKQLRAIVNGYQKQRATVAA